MGIGAVVIGGVFATFWTILAISAPDNSPFAIGRIMFPFWGVLAIAMGIYIYCRARQYQKRFQAYRQRRQSVRPEDSR